MTNYWTQLLMGDVHPSHSLPHRLSNTVAVLIYMFREPKYVFKCAFFYFGKLKLKNYSRLCINFFASCLFLVLQCGPIFKISCPNISPIIKVKSSLTFELRRFKVAFGVCAQSKSKGYQ